MLRYQWFAAYHRYMMVYVYRHILIYNIYIYIVVFVYAFALCMYIQTSEFGASVNLAFSVQPKLWKDFVKLSASCRDRISVQGKLGACHVDHGKDTAKLCG